MKSKRLRFVLKYLLKSPSRKVAPEIGTACFTIRQRSQARTFASIAITSAPRCVIMYVCPPSKGPSSNTLSPAKLPSLSSNHRIRGSSKRPIFPLGRPGTAELHSPSNTRAAFSAAGNQSTQYGEASSECAGGGRRQNRHGKSRLGNCPGGFCSQEPVNLVLRLDQRALKQGKALL